MNAEFFVLAFTAALNAQLLAVDLVLIESRRPRTMFACILAGAMGTAITIGLIDVLVVHADAIKAQQKPSAALDLTLGLILLVLAAALFAGLLPLKRRAKGPAKRSEPREVKANKENRLMRALRRPRPLLAFGIGVLSGLPGAVYLTALHNLVAGHWSTATRVAGVFVFVIIEYLLIIIPWLLLETWPDRVAALLRRTQSWLTGHVLRLMAWICLLLGAYLAITGVVRVLLRPPVISEPAWRRAAWSVAAPSGWRCGPSGSEQGGPARSSGRRTRRRRR